MASFTTRLVVPDKQDAISGFFKVVVPALTFAMAAAFIQTYYGMNGKEIPMFLDKPLLIIFCILLPAWFIYRWYHNIYEDKGSISFTDQGVDFQWDGASKSTHVNLSDMKNLTLVYDGYADFWGPSKGTENRIEFTQGNTPYSLNFRLADEEAASAAAKVVETWYQQGAKINEVDTEGNGRYKLLYSSKYKNAQTA